MSYYYYFQLIIKRVKTYFGYFAFLEEVAVVGA